MSVSDTTADRTDGRRDLRVGVDIGGTFTDIIGFDPGRGVYHTNKVPSTPSNPAEGVIDGLVGLFEATDYEPGDVTVLSHGSTVTVNALIERKGARTGILLTEGFDAVPVAKRGDRPHEEVKNPRYVPPEPLVPQRYVRGVPERVDDDGDVTTPLDEERTREAIAELREKGVDSIAVCLLFSFLNPDHERRVGELIRDVHPDCSVSLSSDVSPRIREYPRLSTTAVSAFVDPKLSRYLADLERLLDDRGVAPDDLAMMLSHGGLSSFEDAAREPAHTLLSGPAAGVQGALFAADLAGTQDIISMDMGGTSCDIAIAPDGEALRTTEQEFDGNPVSVPMVDIQAIGAGGGTIARVESGRLQIGPDSAGADPGPVCYGRGGEEVTITDANALLGRLNPTAILGGDLSIDLDRAEAVIEERIADPLGLSTTEAAAGILRVVDDKMKKEMQLALTKRGFDPRSFSLVTYGGAGPMHALSIARELSLDSVIVPPWPGINSAVGLLTTDRKRLYERSRVEPLATAAVQDAFDGIIATAREDIADVEVPAEAVNYERELELRYAGQSYELGVPVNAEETADSLREKFTEKHRESFGHTSDEPLETMTYRVVSRIETDKLGGDLLETEDDDADGVDPTDVREVYFEGEFRETPIYGRNGLPRGRRIDGPAVVEQMDTTTVVDPAATVSVDEFGNLVIRPGGEGGDR